MSLKRTVFFISDGTGITSETLGHSLLSQFSTFSFDEHALPYVNSTEKAEKAKIKFEEAFERTQEKPIVFATIVKPEVRAALQTKHAIIIDYYATLLPALENHLGAKATPGVGRTHGLHSSEQYMARIDAVNFALGNDDGVNVQNYHQADIILIGVSRCGKTPTCLYLALHYGVYAANYPFTEDDMNPLKLPDFLEPHREKLFGLTIDPVRLQTIRQERRPDSRYAAMQTCTYEVEQVEKLYQKQKIPFVKTTTRSVEEIATTILNVKGVKKRLY